MVVEGEINILFYSILQQPQNVHIPQLDGQCSQSDSSFESQYVVQSLKPMEKALKLPIQQQQLGLIQL